MVKSKEKRNLI